MKRALWFRFMTRVVILDNKYKLGARPAHDRQRHGKADRVHDRLDLLKCGHVLDQTAVPEETKDDRTQQNTDREQSDFMSNFSFRLSLLNSRQKHRCVFFIYTDNNYDGTPPVVRVREEVHASSMVCTKGNQQQQLLRVRCGRL